MIHIFITELGFDQVSFIQYNNCTLSVNVLGNVMKIPKIISNIFGILKKKYSKLSTSLTGDSKSSDGGNIRRSYENIKKNLKTRLKTGKHMKEDYIRGSSSGTDDDSSNKAGGSIRQKLNKFNNFRKEFKTNKFDKLFKKKSSHVTVTPKIPFKTLHDKFDPHYEKHRKPNEQTPSQQPDDSE